MIGEPQGLPKTHHVKVDSHFANQHKEKIPFGRVQGDYRGIYKATERYFHPDITRKDFGQYRYDRVMKLFKQIYAPLKGVCTPCDFGDTYFNPDSSLGYVCKTEMKRQYRLGNTRKLVRTKGEFYPLVPNLIMWMREWSWRFKLPVLWETAGKAEILKEKKVIAGDIRTFTFADPFYTLNYSNLISGVKAAMKLFANSFGYSSTRMGVTFVRGSFTEMAEKLRNMAVVKGDCVKWDSNFCEVLFDFAFDLNLYLIGQSKNSKFAKQFAYYHENSRVSFVRMPAGHVIVILYKVSGDPWTTGGNCQGHEAILLDHLIVVADALVIDPFRLYRMCAWNIYADDHLNGYPKFTMPYLSYEHRSKSYARAGQKLHPPPDDEVQDGPLGLTFLGAEVVERDGRYVPRYSYERLVAILYCNEYSSEELEEVIVSIMPLVATNSKAMDVLKDYVIKYFPHLLGYFDDPVSVLMGEEGIKIEYIHTPRPQALDRNMSTNNNPTTQGAMQIIVAPTRKKTAGKVTKKKKAVKKMAKTDKRMEKQIQTLNKRMTNLNIAQRAPRLQTAIEKGIMDYCMCEGVVIPQRLEYLAALICPREAENIRLPDPYTREKTTTYQTKMTLNIMGVQPVTSPGSLGPNIGRFSIVVNPVFDNAAPAFNGISPNFILGYQDGVFDTRTWNATWVASSGTNFFFYQADNNQSTLANGSGTGFMEKCRPVSASILCTYNGQILNGGGNIAAAFVPGGWWANKAVNATFNSCNWETIAQLKGAYDGPLSKGAYVIWVPEDETDNLLRDVNGALNDSMKIHEYPMLTVCGQVASPTNGFNGSSQLRVDIYINWEYTTENRVIETSHGSKDNNQKMIAYKALATADLSMPNDAHIDWIKTILGGVLGFALGGPVGAALGAASGAGISLAGALSSRK